MVLSSFYYLVLLCGLQIVKVELQFEGKLLARVPQHYFGAWEAFFTIVRKVNLISIILCLLFSMSQCIISNTFQKLGSLWTDLRTSSFIRQIN